MAANSKKIPLPMLDGEQWTEMPQTKAVAAKGMRAIAAVGEIDDVYEAIEREIERAEKSNG